MATTGALRVHLPLWQWAHALLDTPASSRSLQIVTSGYRLPFRTDSALLTTPTDSVPPNYIDATDPEGPWVSRQIDLMLASGVAAP